jgi:hypothetical protein
MNASNKQRRRRKIETTRVVAATTVQCVHCPTAKSLTVPLPPDKNETLKNTDHATLKISGDQSSKEKLLISNEVNNESVEISQRGLFLARSLSRARQSVREIGKEVRWNMHGKWLFLRDWAKGYWLQFQDSRRVQKVCESVRSQIRVGRSFHCVKRQSTDPRDLFWERKATEQTEMLHFELHQMHAKLQEFKDYAKDVAEYKSKFVNKDAQYHGVLRDWQKDLDAIFSMAERLSK